MNAAEKLQAVEVVVRVFVLPDGFRLRSLGLVIWSKCFDDALVEFVPMVARRVGLPAEALRLKLETVHLSHAPTPRRRAGIP